MNKRFFTDIVENAEKIIDGFVHLLRTQHKHSLLLLQFSISRIHLFFAKLLVFSVILKRNANLSPKLHNKSGVSKANIFTKI